MAGWFARKGIPADVRDEYARLYGVGHEEQLRLPAGTSRHEAIVRLGKWQPEIETRFATLRAIRKGEGRRLALSDPSCNTGNPTGRHAHGRLGQALSEAASAEGQSVRATQNAGPVAGSQTATGL